jgi:ketosteroid isomerase-like protein
MKRKSLSWLVTLSMVLWLVGAVPALFGQQKAKANQRAQDPLFHTVQALDKELFDAYNHCDLDKFGSLLADDLEFYHDIGGLARGRQATVDALKNNICGKVTRELVPGTLEVYPIANYGAVEIGVHRFHHPGHDDTEPVGEGKFVQLWHNENGSWKLTRIFSFDHHALKK